MLTRKLTIELWVVGLASAILLALALALNATADPPRKRLAPRAPMAARRGDESGTQGLHRARGLCRRDTSGRLDRAGIDPSGIGVERAT